MLRITTIANPYSHVPAFYADGGSYLVRPNAVSGIKSIRAVITNGTLLAAKTIYDMVQDLYGGEKRMAYVTLATYDTDTNVVTVKGRSIITGNDFTFEVVYVDVGL